QRRHLHLAAEDRGVDGNRHLDLDVGRAGLHAFEARVRALVQLDQEIAGRNAAPAGLALAGEADGLAVGDAGRDLDLEVLAVDDDLLFAAERGLGQLDLEARHHVLAARAPRLGTAAAAEHLEQVAEPAASAAALVERRERIGRRAAARLLLPRAPARRADLAAHAIQDLVEVDVRAAAGERPGARPAARHSAGERIAPELVVRRALLAVAERLVRLRHLFEARLFGLVAAGGVGVIALGELAIRLLDLVGAGGLGDAELFVVVLRSRHDLLRRLVGASLIAGEEHLAECDRVPLSFALNDVAGLELSGDDGPRERVLQVTLDGALERAGAVGRIVAALGEQIDGVGRELELEPALVEQ